MKNTYTFLALLHFVTTAATAAVTYEWTFNDGNLDAALGSGTMAYADAATSGLVSFNTTNGTSVPHISGVPAQYLSVPAFSGLSNGLLLTFAASGPNGGGDYINDYTLIMDIFSPGAGDWQALFNTNTGNTNDADFYIDPSGKLGIGSIGYTTNSVIAQNQWNRIALAADLDGGVVKYFVNGNLVFTRTGGSLADGRFALFSNADAGADLLLFNEGDTTGQYTHPLLVNGVAFTDETLPDATIAALGAAKAGGIVVPEPAAATLAALSAALLLRRRR